MKTKIAMYLSVISLSLLWGACKRMDVGVLNTGHFTDTSGGALKSAASFPIGFGIDDNFLHNSVYHDVVAREGSSVTFGYYMKHGAIVKNDGSFDYSNADAMFDAATAAGLEVYGHTLVWHQNQNATYLNTLTKGAVSTGGPNLLLNGDFETAGSGALFANWSDLNHSNGTFSGGSGANVHGGSASLVATTVAGGNNYNTQILSDAATVTAGTTYTVSYWIKGASAGAVQFELRNSDGSVNYQGNQAVSTSWSLITYSFSAPGTTVAIAFDLGGNANTFYIDDVSISDPNAAPPAFEELVQNAGFETAGSGKLFANWSDLNHSNGAFSAGSGGDNVHGGASSLVATTTEGGNNYNTQILSDTWATTPGKTYAISYWIKGASAGTVQFELRNSDGSVDYQGGKNVSTSWSLITYTATAPGTTMAIAFDLGGHANTFYIDDVSASDASIAPPPAGGEVAAKVDSAMSRFIRSTVTHYAGKVKAWDVVNEPLVDDGSLRTDKNTTVAPTATDYFFWSQYLGRDYALNAFNYARAADPNALLFINDYNLESSPAKLDSLIAFVKELQGKGAKIDGIGTQMHISVNTQYNAIDNMFQKLAATGLKVRISELDVRINPSDKPDFTQSPTALAYQAVMYKYVISSYIKYVPAAQRYGVTIWGVDDATSWINVTQGKTDFPLLFDAKFARKPAYAAVMEALKTPQ
jgi:endo-1,4-beta-xylanase